MRIRTIKPEFFTHEAIYSAEQETKLPLRIAFVGLWCAADREGRFKWEPRRLGVQIIPYDLIDFSRVLDALTTRGFIVKYRVENEDFGVIPSFTKHQVINNREKSSDLPEPLETNTIDACPTRASRVPHACKAEGKGMEGKGRELPPNPQGGMDDLELIHEESQVIPANWQRMSEKDRKRIKVKRNTETMITIGAWFGRRPETLWTIAEAVALNSINPKPNEVAGMGRYYTAEISTDDFRRRDLLTLLNNWTSELDRARKFVTQAA